jgi:pimeloyl-ACP methyl ester carboxylesterase
MSRSSLRSSAVLGLALVLLAAACGGGNKPAPQVFDKTTTPDGKEAPITVPTTPPPPPYDVTYLGQACPFSPLSKHGLEVDCGQLIAPMRRDRPTERTVSLSVARIRSTSPTPLPDPVIYLAGGPGGSALAGVDMWTNPPTPILENRDLILIDQRGTGYSGPRLTCERTFFDAEAAASEDPRPAATQCVDQIRFDHIDPTAYNTDESAADIVDLRKALELPTWNLFGISYGTRLALRVMQLDPEGTRSVVLDSVYPAGTSLYEAVRGGDGAVQAVFADCAAQPACAAAHPNLPGKLEQVLNRLEANPIVERGYDPSTGQIREFTFGAEEFALVLFDSLYVTDFIPDVPKAITLAAAGDLVTSVDLLTGAGAYERERAGSDDGAEEVPPSARFRPQMSEGLYHSVECAEDAPNTSAEAVDAAAAEGSGALRRHLAAFSKRSLSICEVWGVPPRPLTPTTSAIPTLVLAGTYDPITPPAWSELAASTLSAATFVTVAGSGHAVYAAGPCPEGLVKQYIDDPASPLPDCSNQIPEFSR